MGRTKGAGIIREGRIYESSKVHLGCEKWVGMGDITKISGDIGSILGLGRSHMAWGNWAHVAKLLKPVCL